MELLASNALPQPVSTLRTAVLDCLQRGGAVIAGNARAARALRRLHAEAQSVEAQRTGGRLAWPTPRIHDWTGWLDILWRQHLERAQTAPLLLSPLQERAVWKRTLGSWMDSEAGSGPGDGDAVARLASDAWALLSDFKAHGERGRSWKASASRDAELFRGWAASFERECRSRQWMSRSDLAELLEKSVGQGHIETPGPLLLVGFDRLNPAQQELLDAFRRAGAEIAIQRSEKPSSFPRLVQAKDLRDELATCAWWARRLLEANPEATVAVVVQNVEERRGEIERAFREVLMPQSAGIEAGTEADGGADEAMPFEFSLGAPLASVPLVKSALLLLHWLVGPLEQNAISWLMLSGFLGASDQTAELAMLDAEIRRRGRLPPAVSLEAFAGFNSHLDSLPAQLFLRRLGALQRAAGEEGTAGRRKTFSEWIDAAEGFLEEAGWPGERTLDSVEYQAFSRWERLAAEVARLGFDGARVGWREFVTVLDRYAKETIFAPESCGVPIQIMGALESAGQEFDALWFVGADDQSWPPASSPHPLLPLWLQRKAAMPHAGAALDWALHLAVTRRLAASAPQCVFSHALRDDAGELRPSALLSEAMGQPLANLSARLSSEELRATLRLPQPPPQRCQAIRFEDGSSVLWPSGQHAGGAEVLKRQSACAFQSFAVRRLGARELEAAERGLSAAERGTLVHAVLQALWSKNNPPDLLLQSRDDLFNAKADGRLPEILRRHIAEEIQKRPGASANNPWTRSYAEFERSRLFSVLSDWLEFELTREPFSVDATEEKVEAEVGGLALGLRVDRVDRVEGGRFILDYKTGSVTPAMWDGERPDDPQLPIYAVFGPVDDLRGVVFAQVRAGKMDFRGRVHGAARTVNKKLNRGSPLVKSPLTEDTLRQWSEALRELAARFLAGDASVAPREYPKTCKNCPLPGLCRVAETLVPVKAEEEAEDIENYEGGYSQ